MKMDNKKIIGIKKKILDSLSERIEIEATEGDDFQKYVYADGKPVPYGTVVGYEYENREGEIELKEGIYYS